MKISAKETMLLLVTVLPLALLLILWGAIPQSIPVDYAFDGTVNDVGTKNTLGWLIPLAMIGTYVLLTLLPRIDPKRKLLLNDHKFYSVRLIIILFIAGILVSYLFTLVGLWDFKKSLPLFMMGFVVVLGNYFPVIRPNYFIGIRTPWTLRSKEVWARTHRFSGSLWMIGGLVGFVILLVWPHWSLAVTTGIVVTLGVCSVVHSYVIHKQILMGK